MGVYVVKVLGWILCAVVGFWCLLIFTRISWKIWLRNAQRKGPSENISQDLKKAALAMLGVCVSAYAALIIYEWRFLSWFLVFLAFVIIVQVMTIGNLWQQVRWGRKLQIRQKPNIEDERATGTESS
jgi:hypothetical protein